MRFDCFAVVREVKRFDELSVAVLLMVDESVFTISGTVLTG
jgi:hypothetical protein